MQSASRIILVTGANTGIGLRIVQNVATRNPADTYLLGARDSSKIQPAIDELRREGVTANIEPLVIDVADDASIETAVEHVKARFDRLDVLVNNAGIATFSSDKLADNRAAFARVLDTNVASVANVSLAFAPLMTGASNPTIVNISSGRAALTRSSTGQLPKTAAVPYSVSKTALNALTVELAKMHPHIRVFSANPGHCKTAFNKYSGSRDPLEGADVVTALVDGDKDADGNDVETSSFWETVGDDRILKRVPW